MNYSQVFKTHFRCQYINFEVMKYGKPQHALRVLEKYVLLIN